MQTLSLVKVLQSFGYMVFLICYFEHEESMVFEFQNSGAKVILLDWNRKTGSFKFILRLRKEIRSIRPDVVHVQYMAPGALPIISARLAGVKTVFATVHQPYTKSHGRFAKLILRITSSITTRFLTVSQNVEKSWFGSSSLFDENKPLKSQCQHFTIYNSIDTEKIQRIVKRTDVESLKKEIGIPSKSLLIGAVSRLRYEKGIDLLIEAFKMLIAYSIDLNLLIVGSGQDEENLKNKAYSSDISDKVIFYGEMDWDKAMQLISIMDIVVVPSRFEGFGLSAAEAMAAGKPVIASESYGLKEVVINNETGLTFHVNNSEHLANKLKLLISNRELCRQYGNAGLKRVKTIFDIEVFQKKIGFLYGFYC